jgi:hypothetical protein
VSTLPARYFDGRSARGHEVDLSCTANRLSVQGDGIQRHEAIHAVTLSPRLGTRRRIAFPDGAACELDDSPLLDEWFC